MAIIRLDKKGDLMIFQKTPTKEGPPITEEMKLETAEQLLLRTCNFFLRMVKQIKKNYTLLDTRFLHFHLLFVFLNIYILLA